MKLIYRISAMAAVLCMLIPALGSCAQDTPDAADTSTEAAETEPAPRDLITLAGKDNGSYTIITSDDARMDITQLGLQFVKKIEKEFGSSMSLKPDLLAWNASPDPAAHEFLLGSTNREESAKAAEALAAAGGNRFAIVTTDTKIAVAGSDTYTTFQGLDYILNTYATEENGERSLKIDKNTVYISDELGKWVPNLIAARAQRYNIAFYVSEKIVRVPSDGKWETLQGGGTDGKYAYYGMINSEDLSAIIYKYDLATWELVGKSDVLPTGHTNDITYDSKNKRLVIPHCDTTSNYQGLCLVDAETLTFQKQLTISPSFRAIDYLPTTDEYVLGSSSRYTILDGNFKFVRDFACGNTQYTTQGLCSDEEYLYDVRFVNGKDLHYIVVHTMTGTYYGECPLYGAPSEPENMFPVPGCPGEFYAGFNGADAVCKVTMLPAKWWPK